MKVDKKLNINNNFIYRDMDPQLVYIKIYKQQAEAELGQAQFKLRLAMLAALPTS